MPGNYSKFIQIDELISPWFTPADTTSFLLLLSTPVIVAILAFPEKLHGPTSGPFPLDSMALSFNSLKLFLKYCFLYPDLPILFFPIIITLKRNSASFSFSISFSLKTYVFFFPLPECNFHNIGFFIH